MHRVRRRRPPFGSSGRQLNWRRARPRLADGLVCAGALQSGALLLTRIPALAVLGAVTLADVLSDLGHSLGRGFLFGTQILPTGCLPGPHTSGSRPARRCCRRGACPGRKPAASYWARKCCRPDGSLACNPSRIPCRHGGSPAGNDGGWQCRYCQPDAFPAGSDGHTRTCRRSTASGHSKQRSRYAAGAARRSALRRGHAAPGRPV